MKIVNCCVCDTLYQLFNCINLFYGSEEASDTDVFVGDAFCGAADIVERLKEKKIFRDVYLYTETEKHSLLKEIPYKIQRIKKPYKYIERVVCGEVSMKDREYTDIYISMTYRFSIAMVLNYPNATLHYFDDGLGSYIKKVYTLTLDKKWKFVHGLFGIDEERLHPKKLHVYRKELANGPLEGELIAIPGHDFEDESYLQLMKDIFHYEKNPVYEDKSCVYLTRPNISGQKEIGDLDNLIEQKLLPVKEKCVLRIHQRDLRTDIVDIEKDEKRKLWELVCLDNITEDMYLIGMLSTAQFVSKILYDREPNIVLTFPLYKDYFPQAEYERWLEFVEEVRDLYRDKNKIILIHTIDEFEQLMNVIGQQK